MTKRILALFLALCMLFTLLPMSAMADTLDGKHLDGTSYTVEKVSNPDAGAGDIDGLMPGGDRASSYCWAMAESNGYVYIGTWANGLYQEILTIGSLAQLVGSDMDMNTVDLLSKIFTQGEVDACEPGSYMHAKLFRYNEATGEMVCIFNPEDYTYPDKHSMIYGFRGAATFKGNVYFDAMLNSAATDCEIWRVDPDDNFATPITCVDGGSFRAMCTNDSDTWMYAGGSCAIPEGYLSASVIYATDTGDPGDYDIIADYKDFEYYARYGTSMTVNDVCTFANDDVFGGEEVIASIITSFGVTIHRGHRASPAEIESGAANEHGWVWTEIVGEAEGSWPSSMGDLYNCTLTPCVFKDELYFMSMINPMTGMIYAGMGLVANDINYVYMGIDEIAKTIQVRPSIYRLTNDGVMQMVVGSKNNCPDSIEYVAKTGPGFTFDKTGLVMYNWRECTYNDRMYVNTIDIYNLYKYYTQLTNGFLLGMDRDEFKEEIDAVANLVNALDVDDNLKKLVNGLTDENVFNTLYLLYSGLDKEATTEFLSMAIHFSVDMSTRLNSAINDLKALLRTDKLPANSPTAKLVQALEKLYSPISFIAQNKEHIENYMLVSDTVAGYKTAGGDLWCSTNGVDWECITDNGFGDEYNHGIRVMSLGDDGSLYLGTANPYYGAQLWKLTDETPAPAPVKLPFVDVSEDFWAYDAIKYVYENGLMIGTDATHFSPNSNMTRAMFVTVLYRMAGCPDVSGLTMPFKDVTDKHWAYDAIVWAYNAGVIKGVSATRFAPDMDINRAQVVTMLYRYDDSAKSEGAMPFEDCIGIYSDYAEAIIWASSNDIVYGYPDGLFRPYMTATRAEMASIIANYLAK